jgi:hypothetical protein
VNERINIAVVIDGGRNHARVSINQFVQTHGYAPADVI